MSVYLAGPMDAAARMTNNSTMKTAHVNDPAGGPPHASMAPLSGPVVILGDDRARARALQEEIRGTVAAGHTIMTGPLTSGGHLLAQAPGGIAVIDIRDDAIDPLQLIKQIRQQQPATAIVIITRTCNPALAQRALRAGASAYLTGAEIEQHLLIPALARVAGGERYVSDDTMQGILQGMVETGHPEWRGKTGVLSDREMVIFEMIGRGKTFGDIAAELQIHVKTVATHANHMRRKLHLRSNRELQDFCRTGMEHAPDERAGGDAIRD